MSEPSTIALPRWIFDDGVGQRFMLAITPDGTVSTDGGHAEPQGVAEARELFQRLDVIRPPEGTRYLMLTIEDVPPFVGRLNEEAVRANNMCATRSPRAGNGP